MLHGRIDANPGVPMNLLHTLALPGLLALAACATTSAAAGDAAVSGAIRKRYSEGRLCLAWAGVMRRATGYRSPACSGRFTGRARRER